MAYVKDDEEHNIDAIEDDKNPEKPPGRGRRE